MNKSCVGEECLTICTVPVLYITVLVAASLNCVNVNDLCSCKSYKILSVGKLCKSLISVYCLTIGAVPVLSAAVLVAVSCNCGNINNSVNVLDSFCFATIFTHAVNIAVSGRIYLTVGLPTVVAVCGSCTGCGITGVLNCELFATLHTFAGVTTGEIPVVVAF